MNVHQGTLEGPARLCSILLNLLGRELTTERQVYRTGYITEFSLVTDYRIYLHSTLNLMYHLIVFL